ncbi:hypothetical protein NHX12_033407 [Muraenolepis orangiensis]|uniref:Protein kinase domain-containing protein n=1 Tax=Muraenolepis orangiensis TaxID=630683 RepID=A0A9Q0E3M1_9TELE|nr:hypothetical protein NHX12_033407 [Muraenolepis orangiensis]
MPASRSGAAPAPASDYWVEGSRRDAAIDKKIVRTEIGVLLRLSHPNIIRLKEIFETETNITLVLELVTGGELFDRIVERGYYSERDAAHVIKQILEAVARTLVDMWSVGVILYILLCGFEPFFDARGDQFMYGRILNCDYEFVSPWWDERKLQEFNARRKLKAAMKAVVATSRMHESSRRRTDSCELPGSGASRQGSTQQDPPPDTDHTPLTGEATPTPHPEEETRDYAPALPLPQSTRPPLRHASVIPMATGAPPTMSRKPYSALETTPLTLTEPLTAATPIVSTAPLTPTAPLPMATPPRIATPQSPKNLSNGFPST